VSTTTLPLACSSDVTFDAVGCRLDDLRTEVDVTGELGTARTRLGGILDRAHVALDTARVRCGAARRAAARSNLRRTLRRLAAVRRKLRAGARQGVLPSDVAMPLARRTSHLVDDTRSLRTALQCE